MTDSDVSAGSVHATLYRADDADRDHSETSAGHTPTNHGYSGKASNAPVQTRSGNSAVEVAGCDKYECFSKAFRKFNAITCRLFF